MLCAILPPTSHSTFRRTAQRAALLILPTGENENDPCFAGCREIPHESTTFSMISSELQDGTLKTLPASALLIYCRYIIQDASRTFEGEEGEQLYTPPQKKHQIIRKNWFFLTSSSHVVFDSKNSHLQCSKYKSQVVEQTCTKIGDFSGILRLVQKQLPELFGSNFQLLQVCRCLLNSGTW